MKRNVLFLMAMVLLTGSLAPAATNYWTGAVNTNWSNTGNWSLGAVPGANDLQVFGPAGGQCYVDFPKWNGSLLGGGLLFTNAPFTFSVLTSSPQTPFDVGSQGVNLVYPGAVTIALAYTMYMEGNQPWYVTNGATLTFTNSGSMSCSGPITKTGTGSVQLRGSGIGGFPAALAVNEGTFLINISGGSAITLTSLTCNAGATFSLTENPSGNPFKLRNFSDCIFSGTLTGATAAADYNAFKKDGWGALKFLGAGQCTKSGTLYLRGGPLVLDYTGGGNYGVNKFTDNATFNVDNGVIELDGANDGAVSETLGSLVFGAPNPTPEGGLAGVTIVPGSQPTTVTFANTTAYHSGNNNTRGGMCRFKGVDGVNNRAMFSNTALANNSILGGFAHVVNGSTVDFAAYYHTGSGGLTGVCQLAESGRSTAFAAANNVLLVAGSTTLSPGSICCSLKINGSQNINLSGGIWTNNSGGIIQTGSGTDSSVISNGTLCVGTLGGASGSLFVHADKDLTLDCAVTGLETANGGISKSGAGKLKLTTNVIMNVATYRVRFYEGSLDYNINSDCNLYGSGGGYGPGSTAINNTGTLTKGDTNAMTIDSTEVCCGTVNINGGVLKVAVDGGYSMSRLRVGGAGGTDGQINIASGAKLWYLQNDTWNATDVGGSGTVVFASVADGTGTKYTLTTAGGIWASGGLGSAGMLSVSGNVAWARNGTTNAVLNIDITGTNGVAGTDNDQLKVSGTLTGLNATPANATADLVVNAVPGRGYRSITNTIVSAPAQNFSGTSFRTVMWLPSGMTGTVNYLNGSITLTNVYMASTLTYSTNKFVELSPYNTGAIDNSTNMVITLTGDTFSGTDGSQITNNVVVTNLPAGLTVSMIRTNSGTNVLVALLGTATQQAASNMINNLGFTFLDTAFTLGYASQVANYSVTNLTVKFYDPLAGGVLTYNSTNFQEDAYWNDGRISTTNTITLTGDLFNSPGGGDFVAAHWVTPTNIPAGLTAVVTYVNNGTCTVTLAGQATSHAAASSTNNLGLIFSNAAFFGNNASIISNAAVTNLSVTFLDPVGNVQLLYTNGTAFSESANNDGGIATTLNIVLTNDLFNGTNGENFVATGKVLTNNIPAGLTAVVTRVDFQHLNATLTGNALLHNSPNNVTNLTFNFQNSAFHNTAASAVTNASRSDLSVQYINPVLTYVGSGFTESWRNDGSFADSTPVMVNLVGDTFTGALGANLAGAGVTVANVPVGLTAVATKTAAQTVSLTFSGQALVHEAANNINVTVSFNNAALVNGPASVVTNSGPTNLPVTFVNALSNLYVATAARGGSDSNDGSQAHPLATIAKALTVARDGYNDTINVGTGTFTECNITNSKSITIRGAGQDVTIVQGAATRSNAAGRIFTVLGGGGGGVWKNFGLNNLTARYGYTTGDGAGLDIDNGNAPYWNTYVENCTFAMNDLNGGGAGGGAIVQNKWPSLLFVRNCTFTNNTSPKAGGAIYMRGMGGMEISGCTFVQNQAASGGGGLYMDSVASGLTTIKNSTFAYNSTPASSGGGYYFDGPSACTAALYNCTFYSNSATWGGGIFVENPGTPGAMRLTSCLLATNSAPTAPELYIRAGVPTVMSACLVQGAIGGTGPYTDGGGNQTNVNAKVLPLAANGGPTWTCAIASDSPAHDAGSNPLFLTTDQRGTGYARVRGASADVGAYEYGAGYLTYSTNRFAEPYPYNTGGIDNTTPMLITLTGDTFTGTDGSQITNNVTVTNLPAGLTVSMVRTNGGANAVVTLLGNATQQAASNTVTNLGFTFADAAFTLGNASQIGNYSVTNLTVQFYDPVTSGALTYGGTNFQEDATWNDGRIATTNTIVLTGDSFNSPGGGDFVAVGWVVPANVPPGLTAVVTYVSSTNVNATLVGRASAHAAANSVGNFGLTFTNAAFFGGDPSLLANATTTNLSVTFIDPALNVQLLYTNGTVFSEAAANDGSIATTLNIALTNDLFNGTNGENFVATGKVLANNIPAGLTAVVTRLDLTHASVTLTGNALLHNSGDNVGYLTFAFQNSAFHNTATAVVTNASRSDISVQYINPALTCVGSGFTESWQNDGTIDNSAPVLVNLAGDTFAGSIGGNLVGAGVTVGGVPSGLTAVVTKTAPQTAAITLTGTATANEAANSTNVTVNFGDAAFARGPASVVTNSGATNLTVTFFSASSNLYVATVAGGGNDSNDGSLAHPFATIKKAVSVARAANNDTINVLAGIYTESNIVVSGKSVTIQGAGKGVTIVQGAATPFSGVNQYIFWLWGSQTMAIRDMTIRYGDYSSGTPQGAAIYSSVPGLYVTGCSLVSNNMVSANTVAGGSALSLGGGLAARAAVLNCDVSGNTVKSASAGAGSYGGGLAVWQSLVMSNCTLSANVASNGGALYVNPGCPSVSVYDSSFSGNTAALNGGACMQDRATNVTFMGCSFVSNSVVNAGGGLEVEATTPAYTYLINCTFAGNTAGGGGGGFLGHYGNSLARIYNCTFAGNTAGTGGGVAMSHCTSWVIDGTILASNSAPTAPDLDQSDGANGHTVTNCLIGNNSGCTTIFPAVGSPAANGCYVGNSGAPLNPLLGPASDNGGKSLTCPLLRGSIAIDHGGNTLGLTSDQRGAGYPRQVGVGVDIGAFEYMPQGSVFKFR